MCAQLAAYVPTQRMEILGNWQSSWSIQRQCGCSLLLQQQALYHTNKHVWVCVGKIEGKAMNEVNELNKPSSVLSGRHINSTQITTSKVFSRGSKTKFVLNQQADELNKIWAQKQNPGRRKFKKKGEKKVCCWKKTGRRAACCCYSTVWSQKTSWSCPGSIKRRTVERRKMFLLPV